jgi:hypothetical protein
VGIRKDPAALVNAKASGGPNPAPSTRQIRARFPSLFSPAKKSSRIFECFPLSPVYPRASVVLFVVVCLVVSWFGEGGPRGGSRWPPFLF